MVEVITKATAIGALMAILITVVQGQVMVRAMVRRPVTGLGQATAKAWAMVLNVAALPINHRVCNHPARRCLAPEGLDRSRNGPTCRKDE